MLSQLHRTHALIRQYGWRRCLFRATHDWKRKHGLLKRNFPVWNWEARPLAAWLGSDVPGDAREYRAYREQGDVRFFFDPGSPPQPRVEWCAGPRQVARALRDGRFPFFGHLEGTLGFPRPDWFLNPFTGQRDSAEGHWCDRDDFEPQRGDVKFIWEASRFAWAFALARAYAADPRDDYAETFWQLLEAWIEANPPQRGPHWMCGQEIAFRILACTFAVYTFWTSRATTAERLAALVTLLAGSAQRIAGNINAARNQMGNHATSEAAGLWTVGVLFPELAEARRWRELGHYVLEDEARQYNWTDGSYVQHSMNYQRLMLQTYLWCLRLGELNGQPFSHTTRARLAASCEFLYQLQDERSGRLPNYGPNDGALLLPLSACDYLDYRPTIGSLHYLLTGRRRYEEGSWLESLLWLFGAEALDAPVESAPRSSRDFPVGGYYTLRSARSWALLRCHTYRNRPNQADMLHLDLWWRGLNLLRDSGTFSYYDPVENWDQYFRSTTAHNTLTIGGAEQMIKGPRFRWYSLVESRHLGRQHGTDVEFWGGEHYGYRRLACRATHRRTVGRLAEDCWVVLDDVIGAGEDTVELYWQLPDLPYQSEADAVTLQTPAGTCRLHVRTSAEDSQLQVFRALAADGARAGWESPCYALRLPALTVRLRFRAKLPARIVTWLGLGVTLDIRPTDLGRELAWRTEPGSQWNLGLAPPQAAGPAVVACQREGEPCGLRS
jgi:asparagine synthase (glutamine-hydrolysing)